MRNKIINTSLIQHFLSRQASIRSFGRSASLLVGIIALILLGCGKKNQANQQADHFPPRTLDSLRTARYFNQLNLSGRLQHELDTFYQQRDYALAWVSRQKPGEQVPALLTAIDRADQEGLVPAEYDADRIRELQKNIFPEEGKPTQASVTQLAEMDLLLTANYLKFASHLLSGRINPEKLDKTWKFIPRKKNLSALLEDAIQQNTVAQSLVTLNPYNAQYIKLKGQLARYQTIAAKGGWPLISTGEGLMRGARGPVVESLHKLLLLSGDLDSTTTVKNPKMKMVSTRSAPGVITFDETMRTALQQFQVRHGLAPSGKVDQATLTALNVPIEKRIEQISLNMERLRWHPDSLGPYAIQVNVPEFTLRMIEKRKPVIKMRVIVGSDFNATPIFSDTITYLVFSPDWTVPKSIIQNELWPKLQKNPGMLAGGQLEMFKSWDANDTIPMDPYSVDWASLNPETFPYRIVQKSGPNNPLGVVKFVFPNAMSIYLHDTPNDRLFDVKKRELSHGCIRLERPLELAKYLLRSNQGDWSPEVIDSLTHLPKPKIVKLAKKIPVQLAYWTAWVDEDGLMNFREDIYGYDLQQLNALRRRKKNA